jgi:hypothetical protein
VSKTKDKVLHGSSRMKFSKGEKGKKIVFLVFLRRYNNGVSREYLLFVF